MDLDTTTHPVVCDMVNYRGRYCGMDKPGNNYISKEAFLSYPVQDFSYNFNSWGFRAEDFEQYRGKPVNLCLGDSMTLNWGGPIEHSWPSQLAKHFDFPTLNFGVAAAGNDAILKIYQSAIQLFDVQNVFVMYSYFHRRLINGKFVKDAITDDVEDFAYFNDIRINNSYECALPGWNWAIGDRDFLSEKKFLTDNEIYFLDIEFVNHFSEYQNIDRQYIIKDLYNKLKGRDWPSYDRFVTGADPHPDMLTRKFDLFVGNGMYTNRDGHHLSYTANEIYANYLHTKWSQHES